MAPRSWESTGLEVLRTNDFEGTRLRRAGVYAVCFGATWCLPTRRFVPKFVALREATAAHIAIADITDWDDPLWDTSRIRITPTMVVFQEGEAVGRFDGRRIWGLGRTELDGVLQLVRTRLSS